MRTFVFDLSPFTSVGRPTSRSSEQPAVLDDWEVTLVGEHGSIEPRVGSVVYGLLVDGAPGPPGYVPIDVEARIWTEGGAAATVRLELAKAWVAPAGLAARPAPGWLDAMIDGARLAGLPAEWIDDLERKRGA